MQAKLTNSLEKELSRKKVIEGSGMNTVYGYQLLSGHRSPSRDKLLCLAFGLNMNTEEAQELLKKCGTARLYDEREETLL